MRAVILAGGEGTRMRPLTDTIPKSLLPIANRPFLEHQLALMARHGITEAILLTGYLASVFDQFVDDMAARGIVLEVSQETEPLGTCGAVRNALDRVEGGTILVFNGDVLTHLDLGAMIAAHQESKAVLSIALKPVADAGAYGLVRLDENRRVEAFIEKPPPDVAAKGGPINAGTYLIEPRALADVPPGVAWSFERQTFPALVEAGEPVHGFVSDGYWLDIGTPRRYLQAHRDLLDRVWTSPVDDLDLGIGPDGRVAKTAMVAEPVCAGAGTWIGAGSRVGPHACLGAEVRIATDAVVEDSVLHDGAIVGPNAVVRGSILGPGAQASPGAKVSDAVVGEGRRLG
jgi:mannose-1-phosphate guanylyltransferase